MDKELSTTQTHFITSSIQFLVLYYSTKNEPHFGFPRLFLIGHALECILKALFISERNSLPDPNHRIGPFLEEKIRSLFSQEEKLAYDSLYGEGFKRTKNFDIGLHQKNQEAVELFLIIDFLRDLKYGVGLKGESIASVEISSVLLNHRLLDIYKVLLKKIDRKDLQLMCNVYLSAICNEETKRFFTDFLKV